MGESFSRLRNIESFTWIEKKAELDGCSSVTHFLTDLHARIKCGIQTSSNRVAHENTHTFYALNLKLTSERESNSNGSKVVRCFMWNSFRELNEDGWRGRVECMSRWRFINIHKTFQRFHIARARAYACEYLDDTQQWRRHWQASKEGSAIIMRFKMNSHPTIRE